MSKSLFNFDSVAYLLQQINRVSLVLEQSIEIDPLDSRIIKNLRDLLGLINELKRFCNQERLLKKSIRFAPAKISLFSCSERLLFFALSELCLLSDYILDDFNQYAKDSLLNSKSTKLLAKHIENYTGFCFLRYRIACVQKFFEAKLGGEKDD